MLHESCNLIDYTQFKYVRYYYTKRSLYEKMYDDFVGIDINMEQFQRNCNDCWNRTLGFKK